MRSGSTARPERGSGITTTGWFGFIEGRSPVSLVQKLHTGFRLFWSLRFGSLDRGTESPTVSRLIGCCYFGVAAIQTILHYLGLLGIELGVVTLLFGNTHRAGELVLGGALFVVAKYAIGLLLFVVTRLFRRG